MKPIHINTVFSNKQAENLKKLSHNDIGKLRYSDVLRIAFDYYCENNPDAIKKLKGE